MLKAVCTETYHKAYPCPPLTREVASAKPKTEGETSRCSVKFDYPSVGFADGSPDKGSQESLCGFLQILLHYNSLFLFLKEITMRLDKYLKVSRLIKRRTVANEACDAGRVTVNGKVARASYDVKVGDEIALTLGAREVRVEVVAVQETVAKNDASLLYKIL